MASYIGVAPPSQTGIVERYRFSGDGSTTVFSGNDVNAKEFRYTSTNPLLVFLNGAQLVDGIDFTKTSDTQVTFTTAPANNDVIEFMSFGDFDINSPSTTRDNLGIELNSGQILVGNSSNNTSKVTASGDATISNTGIVNVVCASGSTFDIAGQTNVSCHIIPTVNEVYDLGSTACKFRDLYLSGTTICIGDAKIQYDTTCCEVLFDIGGCQIKFGKSGTIIGPQNKNFASLTDVTNCITSCVPTLTNLTMSQICDANTTNWNTAYSWGDHSTAGYLTSQTSHADVLVDGDFTSSGLMATNGSGTYSIVTNNSSNWDTAYGWGDHSSQGYLTSISSLSINTLNDVDTSSCTPTNGQALVWNSANSVWVPGNVASSGITLTDLSVTQNSASGSGSLTYDNTTGVFTYTPPSASSSNVTSIDDLSDVTITTPSSGQILEYNGSTWVNVNNNNLTLSNISVGTNASASCSGGLSYNNTNGVFTYTPPDLSGYLTSESDTLNSVIGRGNTTTCSAVIPFYYANQSAFPSATTYHGAIAHSHSDGAMYFAHAGSWNKLANSSDLSSYAQSSTLATVATTGAYSDLSGTPTLATVATSGAYSDLSGTPTLATVATSGAYSDLSGTPNLTTKQDTLVSGTNIKTINGSSLLGSGNLTISGTGGSSSLTVSEIDGSNNITNSVSTVDTIRFDKDTGFEVTDLGSGEIKVSLGSAFKTLQVSGQSDLVATGEDTLELVAGTGISISTDTSSTPKSLTITATGSSVAQVLNNGDFSDNTSAVELTTTTSDQILDTFVAADYRTAKYTIQAINGGNIHSTEVFFIHDDVDVFITEYATVKTDVSLFTVSAEISGLNVNIIVTPTYNDTTFDYVRTLITARVLQNFPFEGDLQSLSGAAVDLQTGSGDAVDLSEGLFGDLQSMAGTVDLQTDTGSEDLAA